MGRKTILIRVNEETRDKLDIIKGTSKGYSDTIEYLLEVFRAYKRVEIVSDMLVTQYGDVSHIMSMLDKLDDYLNRYCQDCDESWIIPKIRSIVDTYAINHGDHSKSEVESE